MTVLVVGNLAGWRLACESWVISYNKRYFLKNIIFLIWSTTTYKQGTSTIEFLHLQNETVLSLVGFFDESSFPVSFDFCSRTQVNITTNTLKNPKVILTISQIQNMKKLNPILNFRLLQSGKRSSVNANPNVWKCTSVDFLASIDHV